MIYTVLCESKTVQCFINRFADRLQQMRRFRNLALQTTHKTRQRWYRRALPRQELTGFIHVTGDLFGFHHDRAARGQLFFLTRLRIKFGQLFNRRTQIIAFTLGLFDAGAMFGKCGFRIAPGSMALTNLCGLLFQTAESIQQCPMKIGIDQRAIIVLAMNFHKPASEIAKKSNTSRLIVDEDTRATIAHLQAAQNDVTIIVKTVIAQKNPGRMRARHIKYCCHLS